MCVFAILIVLDFKLFLNVPVFIQRQSTANQRDHAVLVAQANYYNRFLPCNWYIQN